MITDLARDNRESRAVRSNDSQIRARSISPGRSTNTAFADTPVSGSGSAAAAVAGVPAQAAGFISSVPAGASVSASYPSASATATATATNHLGTESASATPLVVGSSTGIAAGYQTDTKFRQLRNIPHSALRGMVKPNSPSLVTATATATTAAATTAAVVYSTGSGTQKGVTPVMIHAAKPVSVVVAVSGAGTGTGIGGIGDPNAAAAAAARPTEQRERVVSNTSAYLQRKNLKQYEISNTPLHGISIAE